MELTESELRLLERAEKLRGYEPKKGHIILSVSLLLVFPVSIGWGAWVLCKAWLSCGDTIIILAESEGVAPVMQPFFRDIYYRGSFGLVFAVLFVIIGGGFLLRILWGSPFRRSDLRDHQHLVLRLRDRLRETGDLPPKPAGLAETISKGKV